MPARYGVGWDSKAILSLLNSPRASAKTSDMVWLLERLSLGTPAVTDPLWSGSCTVSWLTDGGTL